MFKQQIPELGLTVEQGKRGDPADGGYQVQLRGKVMLSTRSRPRALAEYRRLRDDLTKGQATKAKTPEEIRAALRKERGDLMAAGMLAASSRRKKAKAMGKGGRGGRGGT